MSFPAIENGPEVCPLAFLSLGRSPVSLQHRCCSGAELSVAVPAGGAGRVIRRCPLQSGVFGGVCETAGDGIGAVGQDHIGKDPLCEAVQDALGFWFCGSFVQLVAATAAAFCSWYVLIFHPFAPKSTVLQENFVQFSPNKTMKILLGRKGELSAYSALCHGCESTTGTSSPKGRNH